jgi:hypothetical protein
LRQKHIYAACFVLHFWLVLLSSGRHAASALAEGGTLLPGAWNPWLRRADAVAATALGEHLPASNPLREGIAGYTYSAGIETGYGFFAPRPSSVRKLVFEIRYADGHAEYELPRVGGSATGLRLTLLFDNIMLIPYEQLRVTMLKMMAFSVWREHPEAMTIRAVFGVVTLPSIWDFERGKKESYEVVYAYDFRFSPPAEP